MAKNGMNPVARVIAYYLPQFHPIPENDEWWGKGFTEWTNVGKAKPMFRGHRQPRVPADLGYYDLRVIDVQYAQEKMAEYAGVEGFAYWHYWWAGKQLLEKPVVAKLQEHGLNLPFCLAWANETWSGVWLGNPGKIMIEQTYPGKEDHIKHFYSCLPYFSDGRYICIDSKPLFVLYRPLNIPDLQEMMDLWNELAIREGLNGVSFVGVSAAPDKELEKICNLLPMGVNSFWAGVAWREINGKIANYVKLKLSEKSRMSLLNIFRYEEIIAKLIRSEDYNSRVYPTLLPQWDNSPRSGRRGVIYTGSTPNLFKKHIEQVLSTVHGRDADSRLIFLKSWNEWAEGNYVEPDTEFGWGYLDALREMLLPQGVQK